MSTAPQFRLSELAGIVAGVMDQVFSGRAFWVIADVTSHSYRAGKNHHYFDLVEKDSQSSTIIARFSARAWTDGAEQIATFEQSTGQRFTNDINVLALVSLQYHPAFGLQLILHDIDTNFTLGTLEKQKQATLQRLLTDNAEHVRLKDGTYVTFNQELELPRVVQRIAVISSSSSAGYEDFVHTLKHNPYGYTFKTDPYFTVVQGENNAQFIVEKLIEIFHSGKPYDAVIIIRGGGAQTDLLLFEQYAIGRAIARFPIPVITGIGHHKNETVADLMAHTSVKTPTKAAEFIIARNRDFYDEIISLEKSIIIHSQQLLADRNQGLAQLNTGLINAVKDTLNDQQQALALKNQQIALDSQALLFKHRTSLHMLAGNITGRPEMLLYQKKCDLAYALQSIKICSKHRVKSEELSINRFEASIRMLQPENILKKGFAILSHNGKLLHSAENIEIGNVVDIKLADQTLSAQVISKNENYE
ncbi:exodeoxyribonuclease VII large subunit [Mucilaginibacter sp. Bleaf8]|uniref:exodeoxyribonuclease VII large subunit n=1 Tax=Mucilaginibacter sp. Bleaf8 TaxID=2834430 RepID=UPI001BCDCB08|nr:exodeoxyribonuclease VII large subunit [Mucilaginibacter sp. Bleaf8]MBS7563206.1 exodeoxyribonuclease VII large subunit [Mucilaginibacter sp. Bleaf8]